MKEETTPAPSKEVRAAIREFVRVNRERYGLDWKRKLAEEMAGDAVKFLEQLKR